MPKKMTIAAGVWIAAFLFSVPLFGEDVKEIRVKSQGPYQVDEQSVLAFTSLKPGDELSAMAISRDIKSLEKTGRFAFIRSEVESIRGGIVVTYIVECKPRIRRLEILGADELGNKKVRELLELGVGDLVDESAMAVHAQKVTETYYKKYFPDAKLTWEIKQNDDRSTADVRIKVVEGKRASVKRITFTGNRTIKSRQLKKVMKQRTTSWLSFITGSGTYSPDDLEMDLEALKGEYRNQGFLDASAGEPSVNYIGRRKLEIVVPIKEGKQYEIRNVDVRGIKLFPQVDVAKSISIKSGDVASVAEMEKTSQAIRDYYGSRGYIRSVVNYTLNSDPVRSVVDVNYEVAEGKLAYIRNIFVRGNTRTKDKVIRRELAVYPGEIFNEVKVRTSEKRLRNLGYFSQVSSVPESTVDPEKYDLSIEVEEQKTGQFIVGAGFSSVDDLIGFVELSQGNFDIKNWPYFTGGGQKMKIRTQLGTKRKDYELSFVEPWFLNRRLSLGLDLFQHDSSYYSDEYDQRNTGGDISLGKAISAYNRVNLTYGLEEIRIDNVSSNASDIIKQEEGTRTKSSLTLELVHNSCDSVFVPTRGNHTTLSATVAGGPLGADTDLYEFQARSSQFWPLWFDHVFNLRGWMAVVEEYGDSDRVPIFDRLFLGGARTMRGFKYREVGPKDENGEPIGGKSALYGTAEYTIPLVEKVRFATYYDVGMVWEPAYEYSLSGLNSAAGIGLRLDFPGFPIQLDYAWPLETDEFNDRDSGRFSFWLGYVY